MSTEPTKTCKKCSVEKPVSEFNKKTRNPDGLNHACRECVQGQTRAWHEANPRFSHDAHLRRNYGLTIAQYEAKLDAQGGVCAACGQPETALNGSGEVRRLAVDHCHATGVIRDLLCARCNQILGFASERPEVLFGVALYADRWRHKLLEVLATFPHIALHPDQETETN